MTGAVKSPESMHEARLGQLDTIPRAPLMDVPTSFEAMPNLSKACGGARLFVKRDDCMGLAFGGNKVRQLEFYFGAAVAEGADTVLITGAVQSNFARLTAAAACKLGMACHIQLEERVQKSNSHYRDSGNVLLERLLGATLHSYPEGEDEEGADRRMGDIAEELRGQGRRPYIIPLGPGHPPKGALGYVVAARELLDQIEESGIRVDGIVVPSGSGNTHAGLLLGLRALGSSIPVHGICVRRNAEAQTPRLRDRCRDIAALLEIDNPVADEDVVTDDTHLAPGYGLLGEPAARAIVLGARTESLMLDPTYTGKAMAGFIDRAREASPESNLVFIHTGGTPAIFAYQDEIVGAVEAYDESPLAKAF